MNLRSLFEYTDNAQEFQAGTTIFAEGTSGDVMYVVLDGEVEVRVRSELVEVVGPGDIVGEMALIDAKVRSATTVAKSDCRLAPVDEKRFLFMVQQTPFFSLHVMRVLAERLRRMDAAWSPPKELLGERVGCCEGGGICQRVRFPFEDKQPPFPHTGVAPSVLCRLLLGG